MDLNKEQQQDEQKGTGRNMSYTSRFSVANRNNPYYLFHKEIHEELQQEIETEKVDFNGKVTQEDLNKKIWDDNHKLKSEVRKKLIKIAKHFYDFLNVDIKVKDIIVTGSMANYNWTENSDIDLHLVIDYGDIDENLDLVQEYLDDKKKLWEERHDIKFYGFDVEVYAQSHEQQAKKSAAIYSIVKNDWILQPHKEEVDVDVDLVKKKAASIINMIEDLSSEKDAEKMVDKASKIKERIKKLRKVGLEKGGEYSPENLAFKVLRNKGYLQKMTDITTNSLDKSLSLNETIKEGLGLNDDVFKISNEVTNNIRKVIFRIQDIIYSRLLELPNGKFLSRDINFDDYSSSLKPLIDSMFGPDSLEISLEFRKEDIRSSLLIEGSHRLEKKDSGYKSVIAIQLNFSSLLFDPKYDLNTFKKYLWEKIDSSLMNVVTHELKHWFEKQHRSLKEPVAKKQNLNYNLKHILSDLKEDLNFSILSHYFYLSSDDEINARVAEIASVVRKVHPGASTQEVYNEILNTNTWEALKFLEDFSGKEIYKELYYETYLKFFDKLTKKPEVKQEPGKNILEKIASFFGFSKTQEPEAPIETIEQKVKNLVAIYVNEVLNKVIEKVIESEKNLTKDADFKRISGILKNNDPLKLFEELEKYFKYKAQIMKKRMLKTIALHLQKDEMTINEGEIMNNINNFGSEEEYKTIGRIKNILSVQEGIEDMTDEKIDVIVNFIKFCCQKMHIKNPVKVVLRRGRDEYIKTTASYVPSDDENHIRCGGRALVDICRSIAHELTHNRQREMGMFKPNEPVQNIGGHIESQADTMAGILIKDFTHHQGFDHIYDI